MKIHEYYNIQFDTAGYQRIELYLHKHYFTKLIIIYDSPCVFKCIFKVVLLIKALEHTGQECARDK